MVSLLRGISTLVQGLLNHENQEIANRFRSLENHAEGTLGRGDLVANWDPWNDFDKPITELRQAYNIVPR